MRNRTRGVIGANLPRALVEAISGLLSTLNPHVMFHELLTVVDFDHNVLLDFLVSNETDFLLYLLQYVRYVTFFKVCQLSSISYQVFEVRVNGLAGL
jgi:hypothetical protein